MVAEFEPRNKDEANVYRHLGMQGVLDLREMQTKVKEDRGDLVKGLLKYGSRGAFETARMLPVVGEIIDGAEVAYASKTGKDFYDEDASAGALAAMMGAGLVIPNIIERPARAIGRGVKKFFKLGNKSKDEFDVFASGLNSSPKAQRAQRRKVHLKGLQYRAEQDLEDLNNMRPSRKLKATAEERAKEADRLANPSPLDVDRAILRGDVNNPYDRETHLQAMKNMGEWVHEFTPGRKDEGYRVQSPFYNYTNWLALRKPELMKRVADNDMDALRRVYEDKSLADEFVAETQRTYRGVEVPKDSPIIEDVLINPKGYGMRAYGEGVYTTGAPGKARTYTGQGKGSVGVLQTDIDYDSPLDLLRQLRDNTETQGYVGHLGQGEYLKPNYVYGIGGGKDVRLYNQFETLGKGRQPAKLKVIDVLDYDEAGEVIKDLNRVGIDEQFWGSKTFDPSKLNDKYLKAMRGGEGFVTAQNELKALNVDQVKKLEEISKRYEVGAAVAQAAEIGIVVSPVTVAIMRATNDEGTASKYASNQKAQSGVTAVRKKRDGMSTIRK